MISHKWMLYSCLAWLFILPTDMVMYPKVDVDKEANLGVTSTNDGKNWEPVKRYYMGQPHVFPMEFFSRSQIWRGRIQYINSLAVLNY